MTQHDCGILMRAAALALVATPPAAAQDQPGGQSLESAANDPTASLMQPILNASLGNGWSGGRPT